MSNFIVVRPNFSPYLPEDYEASERALCKSLNLEFQTHIPKDKPFALITDTHVKLDKLDDETLSRLRLIVHPNSGYDNLSSEVLKQYSIPAVSGSLIRAQAVSEYIQSCIFTHFTQLPLRNTWSQARKWNRGKISEQKVLIIGHGHIGSRLASSLSAMGTNVYIHDPKPRNLIQYGEHIHLDNFELAKIDIIILCANLDQTLYLDKAFFNKLNEEVLFINPARGKLVNTDHLLDFFRSNPKATAFLDVLEQEPPSEILLQKIELLKNVNLTSHIAGVFKGIHHDMLSFEKKTLTDFIQLSLEDFLREYRDQLI